MRIGRWAIAVGTARAQRTALWEGGTLNFDGPDPLVEGRRCSRGPTGSGRVMGAVATMVPNHSLFPRCNKGEHLAQNCVPTGEQFSLHLVLVASELFLEFLIPDPKPV